MQRLIEEAEIQTKVAELGRRIAADYHGRSLTVIGILTGSIVLLADLIRRIDLPLRISLIQASSYRGRAVTPGELLTNLEFLPEITGRNVLLLDDIFDSGRTLQTLNDALRDQRPRTLRSAVLLKKRGRSTVDLQPDYCGFEIPDLFVVGYGLDYNGKYRHLPYIAALEEDEL